VATRLRGAELEAATLDAVAGVFAARGVAATSVQAAAEAAGFSKTGLLSRYKTKDGLFAAVADHSQSLISGILEELKPATWGPERDDQAVELFTDMALASPGSMALLLAALISADDDLRAALEPTVPLIWRIFDPSTVDIDTVEMARLHPEVFARRVRAVAAIGAIVTVVAATNSAMPVAYLRPLISTAARNALG
jgi:AcrR family transcriptional regulator